MKMETWSKFDSVSELPPLPQEYNPMEYSDNYAYISSVNTPLESLVPFPPSDFFPSSDQHFLQIQRGGDSFYLESPFSLLNRHHLTDSTHFEEILHGAFPDVATSFLHMPDLQSFEHTVTTAGEKTRPFPCLSPPPEPVRHGEKRRHVQSSFTVSPSSSKPSCGGERRRKISEKIRSLEKLMPWEKKMEMAAILEEAYKYIKFLQAQISAFQWMPLDSIYCTGGGSQGGGTEQVGLLKTLTRQQILQVMANSPGVRTVLYTRGVCVISHEQLLSLKMMAQSTTNL